MKIMHTLTALALVGGSLLGAIAPAAAAPDRAPGSEATVPACSIRSFVADHATGEVSWVITCSAERDVVVDATAFRGTPDDHVIVDERNVYRRVTAGATWAGSTRFTVDGIDQIRAQAMEFVDVTDPTDVPTMIGDTQG